jgi:hypothetical protein
MNALARITDAARLADPAAVLEARALARAYMWLICDILDLLDAVDPLQHYAEASGLVADIGVGCGSEHHRRRFRAAYSGRGRYPMSARSDPPSDPRYDPKRVAELHRRFEKKMAPRGELDCILNGDPVPKRAPTRPTPQCTIDAIMFSVRERGLGALDEPDTLERLSRCDERALDQINSRISKLIEARKITAEAANV